MEKKDPILDKLPIFIRKSNGEKHTPEELKKLYEFMKNQTKGK
jgi:hypothetical protein